MSTVCVSKCDATCSRSIAQQRKCGFTELASYFEHYFSCNWARPGANTGQMPRDKRKLCVYRCVNWGLTAFINPVLLEACRAWVRHFQKQKIHKACSFTLGKTWTPVGHYQRPRVKCVHWGWAHPEKGKRKKCRWFDCMQVHGGPRIGQGDKTRAETIRTVWEGTMFLMEQSMWSQRAQSRDPTKRPQSRLKRHNGAHTESIWKCMLNDSPQDFTKQSMET